MLPPPVPILFHYQSIGLISTYSRTCPCMSVLVMRTFILLYAQNHLWTMTKPMAVLVLAIGDSKSPARGMEMDQAGRVRCSLRVPRYILKLNLVRSASHEALFPTTMDNIALSGYLLPESVLQCWILFPLFYHLLLGSQPTGTLPYTAVEWRRLFISLIQLLLQLPLHFRSCHPGRCRRSCFFCCSRWNNGFSYRCCHVSGSYSRCNSIDPNGCCC